MSDQPILKNSTPFDLVKQDIDDLFAEAKAWLNGEAVKTQAEADAVALLLDMARKAKTAADDARVAEKKPHDDAAKAVQEKYRPVLSRADLIADGCKKAVAPFLAEQERQKREAERLAREEAERANIAAQAALQASKGDIEAREEAEKLVEQAKASEAAANRAAKDKGHAKGGARAMTLRTTYRPVLTDLNAAIRGYWASHRSAFEALVIDLAEKDVRAGKREIPGFEIVEEKVAI